VLNLLIAPGRIFHGGSTVAAARASRRGDGCSYDQGFRMEYFLSALFAIVLSLAAAPSFAADARNVSVVNETGYAIKFLGFNAPDDGLDEG
jgi:hypothetical protein